MKQVELRPVRNTPEEYDRIEQRIIAKLKELLYLPLLKELEGTKSVLQNSKDDLFAALEKGTVTFHHGTFRGKFNATITKQLKGLGAQWDKKTATFKIRFDQLTTEVMQAIGATEYRYMQRMAKIDRKLAQILPEEITERIKTSELFDNVIYKIDRDLTKTVEKISVTPVMNDERRAKIAKEWQENMDKYIKNFTEKEIIELRKTVMESAFQGNRYEYLIKGIRDSYGVTRRKARFLARQETNLLVAKLKETRYQEAGVYRYRWKCVAGTKDHPVRPAHKALNGQIFRFDDPPITTEPGEPVRRNNPGEDFNCRCMSIPIVTFAG